MKRLGNPLPTDRPVDVVLSVRQPTSPVTADSLIEMVYCNQNMTGNYLAVRMWVDLKDETGESVRYMGQGSDIYAYFDTVGGVVEQSTAHAMTYTDFVWVEISGTLENGYWTTPRARFMDPVLTSEPYRRLTMQVQFSVRALIETAVAYVSPSATVAAVDASVDALPVSFHYKQPRTPARVMAANMTQIAGGKMYALKKAYAKQANTARNSEEYGYWGEVIAFIKNPAPIDAEFDDLPRPIQLAIVATDGLKVDEVEANAERSPELDCVVNRGDRLSQIFWRLYVLRRHGDRQDLIRPFFQMRPAGADDTWQPEWKWVAIILQLPTRPAPVGFYQGHSEEAVFTRPIAGTDLRVDILKFRFSMGRRELRIRWYFYKSNNRYDNTRVPDLRAVDAVECDARYSGVGKFKYMYKNPNNFYHGYIAMNKFIYQAMLDGYKWNKVVHGREVLISDGMSPALSIGVRGDGMGPVLKRLRAGGIPVDDDDDDAPFWTQDFNIIRNVILVGVLTQKFTGFDLVSVKLVNKTWNRILADTTKEGIWYQLFLALADKHGYFRDPETAKPLKPASVYGEEAYTEDRNWRKMTLALMGAISANWDSFMESPVFTMFGAFGAPDQKRIPLGPEPAPIMLVDASGSFVALTIHPDNERGAAVYFYSTDDASRIDLRSRIAERFDESYVELFDAFLAVRLQNVVAPLGEDGVYALRGGVELIYGLLDIYYIGGVDNRGGKYGNFRAINEAMSIEAKRGAEESAEELRQRLEEEARRLNLTYEEVDRAWQLAHAAGVPSSAFDLMSSDLKFMAIRDLDRRSIQAMCNTSVAFMRFCDGRDGGIPVWLRISMYRYGPLINTKNSDPLTVLRAHAFLFGLTNDPSHYAYLNFPPGSTPLPLNYLVFNMDGDFIQLDTFETTGGAIPPDEKLEWVADYLRDFETGPRKLRGRSGVDISTAAYDTGAGDWAVTDPELRFHVNSPIETVARSARAAFVDFVIIAMDQDGAFLDDTEEDPGIAKVNAEETESICQLLEDLPTELIERGVGKGAAVKSWLLRHMKKEF